MYHTVVTDVLPVYEQQSSVPLYLEAILPCSESARHFYFPVYLIFRNIKNMLKTSVLAYQLDCFILKQSFSKARFHMYLQFAAQYL